MNTRAGVASFLGRCSSVDEGLRQEDLGGDATRHGARPARARPEPGAVDAGAGTVTAGRLLGDDQVTVRFDHRIQTRRDLCRPKKGKRFCASSRLAGCYSYQLGKTDSPTHHDW